MPIFTPPPLPIQRRQAPTQSLSSVNSTGAGASAGTSTVQAIAPFGAGSSVGTSSATAIGSQIISSAGSSTGTSTANATSSNAFPLLVSSDGRYLKQNDGTPFLICAQTTWSLAVDIPLSDVNSFLNTIVSQGFNSVMMNVIEHHYTTVKPPKERGGNLPFTKRLDGAAYTGTPNGTTVANGTQGQFASDNYSNINTQAPDPTFPNNTYWQAVETILDSCLSHNVAVFVWAAYLGFHAGDEGWMSEMVAWDSVTGAGGFLGQPWADNTKSKMWNYGAWLADRWKRYPHLVWVMGGDYGANTQTLDTQQRSAVTNCMAGLKSVTGQASTLFTAHWERPAIATDTTITAGSFDLNLAYCDEAVAELTRRGYAHTPAIPTFLGEYFYENDLFGGSTPYRKYVYWGFLGGIAGGFFGNEQLWRFDDGTPGTDYTTLETTQATLDAVRQFAFWKARPWWRLKPSGLGGMGTIVTAGGGTASPQSTTYVAAAATSEGDLLLAYLPPDHTGSVTIDMTKMSATAQARWFDPANASFTNIGGANNTGARAFTSPGNNSAGDADWLLLLETIAATAAGTSTTTAVGSSLSSTTGTSTGISTPTAIGQSIVAASGTSTGTSTASAIYASTLTGSGTVTGTSTSTGAGAAITAANGLVVGTSAVSGTGASLVTSTGTSTGTSTTNATGITLSSGTGNSSGILTAEAIGASIANGIGSSTAISTTAAIGSSLSTGVGNSAGISTVISTGCSIVNSVGSTTGSGIATSVGSSLSISTGSSTGTSTASGTGAAASSGAGTGLSVGSGTASGVAISFAAEPGISVGTSTVTGVGISFAIATGSASGTSTVLAIEFSPGVATGSASGIGATTGIGSSLTVTVGSSTASSSTQSIGISIASYTGSSNGIGIVSGIAGQSPGSGDGVSQGISTALGFSFSLVTATGNSVGSSIVSGISNRQGFQVPVIHGSHIISRVPKIKLRRRN